MTDGRYRMDHSVTATQRKILNAFDIDSTYIKKATDELSRLLYNCENERPLED